MLSFSIIVAIDQRQGIGKNGELPWHLPEDLKYFKEVTCKTNSPLKKNVVIMGRKTWDSIPEKYRPLSGRLNLVLTKNSKIQFPFGVISARDFQEAFRKLEDRKNLGDIFVIGGQQVFEEAIQYKECNKLYITHIENTFACDAFFPPFSNFFNQVSATPVFKNNQVKYCFAIYLRK